MEAITVRMDTTELDFLSKTLQESQSELIRDLFKEGKVMKALQLYKQRKVSVGLAAKIAGVCLGEFLDVLREYNVTLNLELEDAKASLRFAREVFGKQ